MEGKARKRLGIGGNVAQHEFRPIRLPGRNLLLYNRKYVRSCASYRPKPLDKAASRTMVKMAMLYFVMQQDTGYPKRQGKFRDYLAGLSRTE